MNDFPLNFGWTLDITLAWHLRLEVKTICQCIHNFGTSKTRSILYHKNLVKGF